MYTVLLVINIVSAFVMVGVILLQHGQGAEMGSAFGRGSQGSLIGVTGSANFLSRVTSVLATVFFTTALALGFIPQENNANRVVESLTATEVVEETPAVSEVPSAGISAAGDK